MQMVLATKNKHKVEEFQRMLSPLGIEIIPADDICDIEVEETGATFAENAMLKAKAIFLATGKSVVADDSGLCVDALGGEPGVYSARYAGEGGSDDANIDKLLENLKDVKKEDRGAYFVSAIACILEDKRVIEVIGRCEGYIGFERYCDNGFGYDPVFMVGDESFASLRPDKKDEISHRGDALRKFYEELKLYI